ncbi:protein ACCELERATED CELL DEATH 6 [Eucalyptus grandis]|uniref:protein ACCELERATED CELL DEATH 6 n=1 Tax=Eucalyptus grandis TaxID=71139 RepID=UPI00192EF38B|nr:protein ACCELERATED CELL DEATH 6 [Eucalyptus grandis]XP_018720907.2 protein ACCELERATED CELL DEATH 6 [Eucalyptus grandis]
MDVKVSIGEEEGGLNTSIKVEVQKDEGGASLNNASATARTTEQQDPAKVYAAARKLADVIKGANVEDIISTIETLACQADSSAIFNFGRLSRGSLLHIAAATGKSNILRLLLDRVDAHLIAAQDDWGNTPLHLATKAKAIGVIDMLICRAKYLRNVEDKPLLRIKNSHGNTALHEAVLTRDVDLVSHLLGEDLETVYWENVDQKSPLYLALDTGNPKILEVLLSKSLDPSKIQGLPPVFGAVAREQHDLLGEILKKNVKIFAMTDSKGGNVFHLADFWNVTRVFDLLQPETEYLAREPDKNGDLPIHIASKRGHVELINKLHPVSQWVNGKGQTVLHVAAKYGREEVVRSILKHPDLREMINERDHDGNTPSHLAAKYLQPAALVHLVLDKRMNPSLLNHEGLAVVDSAPNDSPTATMLRLGFVRALLKTVSAKRPDRFIVKPEDRDKVYTGRSLSDPANLKEAFNTLLVVAALVTTVTFAAGFAVPGGLNSSDMASKDDRGMATMLGNRKFQEFVICNTFAMFCSMTSVVVFMLAYQAEGNIMVSNFKLAKELLKMSLPAMSCAFLIGVNLTVGKLPWLATTISIIGSIFIFIITGYLYWWGFVELLISRIVIPYLPPISPLIFRCILGFLNFVRVERTLISDDSKEDRTGSKTSASPPLGGGGKD